jgi:hypothetical protein
VAIQKRCKVCGGRKKGKRCRPCRLASLRRYRERHSEELRDRARSRYQSEPEVREQGKRRNYCWRAGVGREKYLKGKSRESKQRAEGAGRMYRPRAKGCDRQTVTDV